MHTTNYKKFKGEIENYVTKEKNISESSPQQGLRYSHSILWPKSAYPNTVFRVSGAYRKS
jgi:hypothetical protein